MITTKEAFIDAKEVSQILGVGMTKAYAVIKELQKMGKLELLCGGKYAKYKKVD